MRNSMYRITLDMHEIESQFQITAKKNDNSRQVHINLSEYGYPYIIDEGCRAVITIQRPGLSNLVNDCEINLVDSTIVYDFNDDTCVSVGINRCEVTLKDENGKVITTPQFTMLVTDLLHDGGGGGGTSEHDRLTHREWDDQHPISAITGLRKELDDIWDAIRNLRNTVNLYISAIDVTLPNVQANRVDTSVMDVTYVQPRLATLSLDEEEYDEDKEEEEEE